ncbi:MAG: ASCH domain-containing protein [Promicromonosporaceae bacterium]|nr:ASCH domain-containing protein [Promicromonosporaceae bacterium]
MSHEPASPIHAFWEGARGKLGFGAAGSVVGLNSHELTPPPAWAFGGEGTTDLANELLALVLAGTKTGTATSGWEFDGEDEPLPKPGDLSIILDGAGEPRAIIKTTNVEVVPFAEVTAEFAYSEGEGELTLESWRRGHRAFWDEHLPEGRTFTEEMPVVCETFELVYPRR